MLPDNSVDAIVTDAPYELSNDGKQSAAGVFSKFVFPKNAKVETEGPVTADAPAPAEAAAADEAPAAEAAADEAPAADATDES